MSGTSVVCFERNLASNPSENADLCSMKKQILSSCVWLLGLTSLWAQPSVSHEKVTEGVQLHLADPTVVVWNDTYYLTGTDDDNGQHGFPLYSSHDLHTWHREGTLLSKSRGTWGTRGFWAPQWVVQPDGRWLLLYTANEQIAVAEATSPCSPFKGLSGKALDGSEKNIDPFLLRDDDGRCYLYHVRFDHGNYLWVAEMDMQRMCIKQETLRRCFTITQPWELTAAYRSDPIMEGPTVLKLEGKYYMFYSANHFLSPDYAVGYAVAETPMGPWHKAGCNPILHESLQGERGDGHGDVFRGLDGNLYYVYHVHNSAKKAQPRCTRIAPLRYRKTASGELEFYVDTEQVIKLKVKN